MVSRALVVAAALLALSPARAAVNEQGPIYATPTTADGIGRVVAPVFVNGEGPYRFLVDTGANRSTLSPALARALSIDFAGAPRALVHGVTGSEQAPFARVGEMRLGSVVRQGIEMPVIANRIYANAEGIMGADHISGGRLIIDFKRDRIELSPGGPPPPASAYVMRAQMRFGRLPVVTAQIGRVTARAVIDTGAERSLGNPALRAALLEISPLLASDGFTPVYGAVGPDARAEILWAPRLTLAGVRIQRLPILFADTHFFRFWQMENEPALLIGMDVLGQFEMLTIDYKRSEVYFRVRRGPPGVEKRNNATRM